MGSVGSFWEERTELMVVEMLQEKSFILGHSSRGIQSIMVRRMWQWARLRWWEQEAGWSQ